MHCNDAIMSLRRRSISLL